MIQQAAVNYQRQMSLEHYETLSTLGTMTGCVGIVEDLEECASRLRMYGIGTVFESGGKLVDIPGAMTSLHGDSGHRRRGRPIWTCEVLRADDCERTRGCGGVFVSLSLK